MKNKHQIIQQAREVAEQIPNRNSELQNLLNKYDENVEKKAPVNKIVTQIKDRLDKLI